MKHNKETEYTLAKTTTKINSVVLIADFLPRQCGIATFTFDLCTKMKELNLPGGVDVVAMDDQPEGYPYGDAVKFQVNDRIRDDYVRAAEFININNYDLAIVQHEFGIYGGSDGSYILRLMRDLKMPIITTMHTVLQEPSEGQREVVMGIAELSDRIVVMSEKAVNMLVDTFGIPREQICLIPHGIHDVPFGDPVFHKDQFQLERNKVILTFGLLGPSKGLENMIDAMPGIVEQHPDVMYVILGATHPHILRESGESYRQSLHQRARRLGVEDHVQFHNRFVSTDMLMQYLSIADVYCTPYPNPAQITSGTLSYAAGSGKAIVSTPYWHAEELLADDRGVLIPFEDIGALSDAVNDLLGDDFKRNTIRKTAYQHCRGMVWKEVAREYVNLGGEIVSQHEDRPKALASRDPVDLLKELPAVNLTHMKVLTDDNGMLQHAYYTIPDRNHGYCVDDNARALMVTCMEHHRTKDPELIPMIQTYLSFLHYAYNPGFGRFRNFMSYHRTWLEKMGSEDSHGRALWSLGMAVKTAPSESIRDVSSKMFQDALPVCEQFRSPRALAFSLVGAHAYLEVYGGDTKVRRIRTEMANRIFEQFQRNSSDDWPWLENIVTYANGIIPLALMLSGQWIPNLDMHAMGINALDWLLKNQTAEDGHLSLIGNEHWLTRDGERSKFDQQALEPMCLILACCEAYRSMKEERWIKEAQKCLDWYLGGNDLNVQLVSFRSGSCRDGLHVEGASINRGAESTLSWLISLLAMHEIMETQSMRLAKTEEEAPKEETAKEEVAKEEAAKKEGEAEAESK